MLVSSPIPLERIRESAAASFGEYTKAVVDVSRGVMAAGGELHADEEAYLLERGSRQTDLWGINLYPSLTGDAMVEFDSVINVRPGRGNRSRSVEDPALRAAILAVVHALIIR